MHEFHMNNRIEIELTEKKALHYAKENVNF